MTEPRTEVIVETAKAVTFEAAHRLGGPGQPAAYGRLHGHSFRVEATVRGAPSVDEGWVEDLGVLGAALSELAGELDHGYLNDMPGLERPTLERLALWFAERLAPRVPALARVEVSRPSLNERCSVEVTRPT